MVRGTAMIMDDVLRLTGLLLSLAFIQQGAEHLMAAKDEQRLFLPRMILSIALGAFSVAGLDVRWICAALVIMGLLILQRFQGPYNGGSDRMGLLILCSLCAASFMPVERWQEYALGYLALQLVLSYFISGWVKIANPAWRSGQALQDVFLFSAYPVSAHTRRWADRPHVVRAMSWAVMLFELSFPLTLVSQTSLLAGLAVAACFHLANACLFGLNRFLWVWLAAYPAIIWFQERVSQ